MLRADDQEKVYYGGGRRPDSRRSQTLNFTNTNIQYTKYNIQYIQLFTGRFFCVTNKETQNEVLFVYV